MKLVLMIEGRWKILAVKVNVVVTLAAHLFLRSRMFQAF